MFAEGFDKPCIYGAEEKIDAPKHGRQTKTGEIAPANQPQKRGQSQDVFDMLGKKWEHGVFKKDGRRIGAAVSKL